VLYGPTTAQTIERPLMVPAKINIAPFQTELALCSRTGSQPGPPLEQSSLSFKNLNLRARTG